MHGKGHRNAIRRTLELFQRQRWQNYNSRVRVKRTWAFLKLWTYLSILWTYLSIYLSVYLSIYLPSGTELDSILLLGGLNTELTEP